MADTEASDQNSSVFYIGHHLPNPENVIRQADLDAALASGYDLITSYISNRKFRTRVEETLSQASAEDKAVAIIDSLDESEVNIDHMGPVVVFTSPWIELDSNDPLVAHVSRQVLHHELAYAAFCGASYVVISGPRRRANVSQYAQAISAVLSTSSYMQLLIQLPLAEEEPLTTVSADDEKGKSTKSVVEQPYDALSMWDVWNTVRTVCRYSPRLCLALQLPFKLPPKSVLVRWFAEPIKVLMISATIFLPNAGGFPVLSKPIQSLISKYMKLRPVPYILLADTLLSSAALSTSIASLSSSTKPRREDPLAYLSYIRHLQKNQPPLAPVEKFGAGYQDYLQAPLQPLTDNLESITYEVFEKDPVKYDQYEKATRQALEEREINETIVVAVVGAGRGPLVARALKAAEAANRTIELFAVEKNPNAYVTLLRHNRESWQGRVTVIKSDMRSWKPPFQVDILISELLGSFGDNELSPECLDGVQSVLNPEGGITIPASYSAHFTPIMAPKIHADISNRMVTDNSAAETPYVVMLHSVQLLAEEEYIHNAWEFSHPLPIETYMNINPGTDGCNDHNMRFSKHTFRIPDRGVIHGLAGYFESVLFGDVELSTRPDTIDAKSKDMISWFPIYFPIKTPLYVPDQSEVDISIWRLTDGRKVWYEWILETYTTFGNGIRYRLGTSDLHSSKKNGCLM